MFVRTTTPDLSASAAASSSRRGIIWCSTCVTGPPWMQTTSIPRLPLCASTQSAFFTAPPQYVWNHFVRKIGCCHWPLPAARSLSASLNDCWSSRLAFEVPARSKPRVSKPRRWSRDICSIVLWSCGGEPSVRLQAPEFRARDHDYRLRLQVGGISATWYWLPR